LRKLNFVKKALVFEDIGIRIILFLTRVYFNVYFKEESQNKICFKGLIMHHLRFKSIEL